MYPNIQNNIIIYESTVYPGLTEEIAVPILKKGSGLKFNQDFYCGYSPERMNPGDKEHTITNTLKITSGSTPEIAKVVVLPKHNNCRDIFSAKYKSSRSSKNRKYSKG